MIEKNARLEFTLKQAGDEISDGKYDWISIPCRGLLLDMRSNDFNLYGGTLQDGKVFLIAPLPEEPLLPGFVLYGNKEYEIKAIKTLRNLRGVVLGYRIVAAGG
ncbi:MAG: hypothetical protein J6S90_08910 [Lentisphaeria bacterium]|nr:hypothetical protein [Lentisphaeria bacterium]